MLLVVIYDWIEMDTNNFRHSYSYIKIFKMSGHYKYGLPQTKQVITSFSSFKPFLQSLLSLVYKTRLL